jgi:hypothetical protein
MSDALNPIIKLGEISSSLKRRYHTLDSHLIMVEGEALLPEILPFD